ncbi:MAG: hypothetical protein K8S98_08305 [Planctomycetes bacterium]|nr:hypothetical protein [Planctomycetota bacterium]
MSAPDQQRRSGIWKKLALAVVSLVVALLLAEGGMRVLLRLRGQPFDPDKARNDAANAISMVESNIPRWDAPVEQRADPKQVEVLHPYYGFDAEGYIEDVARLVEYFGSDRAERNYDIAILGGSVASIFAADAAKSLVKDLQADPRFETRAIRLWSQARGAYKEPQHAIVFQTLLSYGIKFDAVILIDGFNEVAIGLQNASFGASPLYPSATKWLSRASNPSADREMMDLMLALRAKQSEVTRQARRILDLGLYRSAVASELALGLLWRTRADASTQFDKVTARLSEGIANPSVNGPTFDPEQGAVLRESVGAWVAGSRTIAAMCREYDMPFVHVLQPTLYDEGSKKLTPDEIEKGKTVKEWSEGARLGYPQLRAAGEDLKKRGIDFVDASQLFADVSETLYYDACHFNVHGNELLAHTVAAGMLAAIRHHDEAAAHR